MELQQKIHVRWSMLDKFKNIDGVIAISYVYIIGKTEGVIKYIRKNVKLLKNNNYFNDNVIEESTALCIETLKQLPKDTIVYLDSRDRDDEIYVIQSDIMLYIELLGLTDTTYGI